MENEIEFFTIPHMVISKDDIRGLFHRSEQRRVEFPVINKLTNEQMQEIANRMTDMMMNDYYLALQEAYECVVNEIEDAE
jgi:uncharacterized protein YjgD (DUF1641 family)